MLQINILLIFLISCGSVTKRDSSGNTVTEKKVKKEEVVVKSLNAELIRKILMDNILSVRACYERQIERSGKTYKGLVTMKFTIEESGLVKNTAIVSKDPTFPRPISECVSSALKRIKFPKSRSGVVEVSQPFNFYPSKS